jgi:hypothetical protein
MLDNSVVIHMTEENRKEKRGDLTVTKKERKAVGHPCSGRYLDDPAKWKTKMFWGLPLLALSCSLNCGMALWASSLLFLLSFLFPFVRSQIIQSKLVLSPSCALEPSL